MAVTAPQKITLVIYTPATNYFEIFDASDAQGIDGGQKLLVSRDQGKHVYAGTDPAAALAAVKA